MIYPKAGLPPGGKLKHAPHSKLPLHSYMIEVQENFHAECVVDEIH